MSDILVRLRICGRELSTPVCYAPLIQAAADEIEELRAQYASLQISYENVWDRAEKAEAQLNTMSRNHLQAKTAVQEETK